MGKGLGKASCDTPPRRYKVLYKVFIKLNGPDKPHVLP